MFPMLLTIGNMPVSSFGVFLALAFLVGVFLVWRLSRAWDLDEEKILDLTLLTFLGGVFGARIYFVIQNLQLFSQNLSGIVLINRFPGFSFWGAFLGGWLTLYYLCKRKKLDFWQIGDIASVGFLGSLILVNLGCFFGGCDIGTRSDSFLAVNMVGVIGKRFPVQALEALLLFFVLLRIWSAATHFHQSGKILSLTLIYVGLIKILTESWKEVRSEGLFLSFVLVILGINILYKTTRRSLLSDLKEFFKLPYKWFSDPLTRKYLLDRLKKSWYNQRTSVSWKLRNFKKIIRRLNVRFSYKNN